MLTALNGIFSDKTAQVDIIGRETNKQTNKQTTAINCINEGIRKRDAIMFERCTLSVYVHHMCMHTFSFT